MELRLSKYTYQLPKTIGIAGAVFCTFGAPHQTASQGPKSGVFRTHPCKVSEDTLGGLFGTPTRPIKWRSEFQTHPYPYPVSEYTFVGILGAGVRAFSTPQHTHTSEAQCPPDSLRISWGLGVFWGVLWCSGKGVPCHKVQLGGTQPWREARMECPEILWLADTQRYCPHTKTEQQRTKCLRG